MATGLISLLIFMIIIHYEMVNDIFTKFDKKKIHKRFNDMLAYPVYVYNDWLNQPYWRYPSGGRYPPYIRHY